MKKPEITVHERTGKLHYEELEVGELYDAHEIADAYEGMIDALIVAVDSMIFDSSFPHTEALNRIEKALKKAGCTDD